MPESENILSKFYEIITKLNRELNDKLIKLELSSHQQMTIKNINLEISNNVPFILYQIVVKLKEKIKDVDSLLKSENNVKCGSCSICNIDVFESNVVKFYCCICREYHCGFCKNKILCKQCRGVLGYDTCLKKYKSDYCDFCEFEN